MLDEKDLQAIARLMDTKLKPIDKRLDDLTTRFDGLTARFDGLTTRFDGLTTQFDGLTTRVDHIDARLDRMQGDIGILKEDSTVTRNAANALLDWASDASIQPIPLFKKEVGINVRVSPAASDFSFAGKSRMLREKSGRDDRNQEGPAWSRTCCRIRRAEGGDRMDRVVSERIARAAEPGARVAVMCVGSVLCGDDAAGMLLAPLIRPAAEKAGALVAECSTAPENFSGVVREYRPDTLFLVDAARMGLEPGGVRVVPEEEIAGVSVSTHMMPLKFLIGYLKRLTGCSCALIGVQPACCEPAASPSPRWSGRSPRWRRSSARRSGVSRPGKMNRHMAGPPRNESFAQAPFFRRKPGSGGDPAESAPVFCQEAPAEKRRGDHERELRILLNDFQQAAGVFVRNIFGKPCAGDDWSPGKDITARQAAFRAIKIQISVGQLRRKSGVKQMGAGNIGARIAGAGVDPIDNNRFVFGLDQVENVIIAMAELVFHRQTG